MFIFDELRKEIEEQKADVAGKTKVIAGLYESATAETRKEIVDTLAELRRTEINLERVEGWFNKTEEFATKVASWFKQK